MFSAADELTVVLLAGPRRGPVRHPGAAVQAPDERLRLYHRRRHAVWLRCRPDPHHRRHLLDPNGLFLLNVQWYTLLAILAAGGLGSWFVQSAYSGGPPDLVIAGLTVIDPMTASRSVS